MLTCWICLGRCRALFGSEAMSPWAIAVWSLAVYDCDLYGVDVVAAFGEYLSSDLRG